MVMAAGDTLLVGMVLSGLSSAMTVAVVNSWSQQRQ